MPYIQQDERKRYDKDIINLVENLVDHRRGEASVGEVNYVISSIIWELFECRKSYTTANNLMGVLECVKQEFYRKQVAPYEDKKIKENGDIG
jgi:hypothetical protein